MTGLSIPSAAASAVGSGPFGLGDFIAGIPVPHFPVLPLGATALPFCVTTTPDRGGRLADRSPLRYLRWSETTVVNIHIRDDFLIVVTSGGNMAAVTRQGHLRLPLAVRRRCRIEAGDRLLVFAWNDPGRIVVCTVAVLVGLLRWADQPRGPGVQG